MSFIMIQFILMGLNFLIYGVYSLASDAQVQVDTNYHTICQHSKICPYIEALGISPKMSLE
jgi:hypothetical protein